MALPVIPAAPYVIIGTKKAGGHYDHLPFFYLRRNNLLRMGLLNMPLLPFHFSPGVAQGYGAVEDGFTGFGIHGIDVEISQA